MIEIDFCETNNFSNYSNEIEAINCFFKKENNIEELFLTSGTSGIPKKYIFSQTQIQVSVEQTIKFFGLKKGDTLLNPLPLEFVAGKMNIYRAIYGKLKYIEIFATNVEKNIPIQKIDFATFVPNQLYKILELNKLEFQINKILIGGGEWVDYSLLKKLKDTIVYQSFASTETLTHFAIKQIYPKLEEAYQVLPGFELSVSDDQILVKHPIICRDGVLLDDSVEMVGPNQFKWIGRKTNMIKSGGIKLFPELIEKKLSNLLNQKYVIVGIPDEKFGEIIVLCIEGKSIEDLKNKIASQLDKYEVPKFIVEFDRFPLTESGKIKRKDIINQLKTLRLK